MTARPHPIRIRLPNGREILTLSALEARGTAKQVDAYFLHGIDVQPGAVIVDVGANIGLFALEACSRCHDDLVLYAFEPIPEVFELLKVNLAGCRTEGVKAFPLGLSDHAGEATFAFFPGVTSLSTQYPGGEKDALQTIADVRLRFLPRRLRKWMVEFVARRRLVPTQVHCRLETLSNIIDQQRIARIDLLKIDVEKAEIEVLGGIEDAHWGLIRQIVAEVHDIDARVRIVERMLRDRGFDEITIDHEADMDLIGVNNIYARRTG